MKCRVCGKPLNCGSCRGACNYCYSLIRVAIREKRTTWKRVDSTRVLLPPKNQNRRRTVR